jgi:hypothetical protein
MPARIRVAQDADGFWTCREAISGSPEFIRADIAERMAEALEVLLNEATSFSVSGVYFDESCMGHKGPDLARSALSAWKDGR